MRTQSGMRSEFDSHAGVLNRQPHSDTQNVHCHSAAAKNYTSLDGVVLAKLIKSFSTFSVPRFMIQL